MLKNTKDLTPDYLFEVSWEVCNKVGGIHTVIATKALNMSKDLENRHILIGPDVWRETQQNPEFLEDARLLRSWRARAAAEGLRIRVGRWNVAGNPIAVLVDFTTFIPKKDEIFTHFWESFSLDSISGQWDYVEPALFGYAAGKVIESYYRFNVASHHKAVAQFHEWMTGTGLLYLKYIKLPIATAFTSHATVLGRCIAGNQLPLYDSMELYNPDEKAREYNVCSKHSLEKTSAVHADVFTTVSDITARECRHFLGKEVDLVTPNGFENSFTPSEADFPSKMREGRAKLREMAEALLQYKTADDAFYVGIGGRYEFKNKGIDVFIEALGRLNKTSGKQILAFIMVPAGHNGPNKELQFNLQHPEHPVALTDRYCTHTLSEPEWDPSLRAFRNFQLGNTPSDRVKVFFLPCYLNGQDGLINKSYYDLLIGLDLSVFPSYYEPWGYTPLESLAFKVPTITTSVAGFGLWVEAKYHRSHPGIDVIQRNDVNNDYVVDSIVLKIRTMCDLSPQEHDEYKASAKDVSTIALWDNHVKYYKRAYEVALGRVIERIGQFPSQKEDRTPLVNSFVSQPHWSQVIIRKELPPRLQFLDVLSKNLWWSWTEEARSLFADIDPLLWKASLKNPMIMLDMIPLRVYNALCKNEAFLARLSAVEQRFNTYMKARKQRKGPRIAYFSMEYGLDSSLRIYSGGLGILAGDYLKEASDKGVNITGVGLLYRYGYFTQMLSAQGDQIAEYPAADFTKIPATPVRDANDNWLTVSIALPGRNMYGRIWRVEVGRTELYLLDTDFENNLPEDRCVTHRLYGGNWENRLKQEILLGIGGIRALRLLGIEADVYHCNEGHAAFIGLERLAEYVMEHDLSFTEAKEAVQASSLFTTHTPVPAGHDAFSDDLLRTYMGHYPDRMKTSWETMMALGKIHPENPDEKFSMSYLASNLSQAINGVSWLHGQVSRDILAALWPGYLPEEVPVDYVTNGVHYDTWTAPVWKAIHARVFGPDFPTHHYDKKCFEGIYNVSDKEIWETRSRLRADLINNISDTFSKLGKSTSAYSPREIVDIKEKVRPDILTIGFARRFATYKRAHLLFRNLDHLDAIINNPHRPVQFIFAGKAHPADKAGQDLIKRIIDISRQPRFIGKIIFIPNYDMEVAKTLVSGVDIWLNTPTRPLEASGTSGEKASMNGVMHFSVLDGWWVEGYRADAGWALPQERTYTDQNFQDELDAVTIYNLIEDEIAPLFYERNAEGVPERWCKVIKNCIARVACDFTTNRMMQDYEDKFYTPLYESGKAIAADDFALARERAFWKKRVMREWNNVEVVSYTHPNEITECLALGKSSVSTVSLHIGELNPEDLGVEMVIATQDAFGQKKISTIEAYKLKSWKNGEAVYECVYTPEMAGSYYVAGRIYANCNDLAHRQDFPLVKWL